MSKNTTIIPSQDITHFPTLYQTCLYLQKNSFFYKDIFLMFEKIKINYEWAEKVCHDAFLLVGSNWEEYYKKTNDLIALSFDFLRLQVELEKTGTYKYSTEKQVQEEVFDKSGVNYLWGLYFSEVFWVTHYKLFHFFLNSFCHKTKLKSGRCLDLPVGSGIFLSHFLALNKEWSGTGIDLSRSAIDISTKFLKLHNQESRFLIKEQDFFSFPESEKFDKIICVEFLEHVENPLSVLQKIYKLSHQNTEVFLTTVTWAAAIDHIYLYKTSDDIRKHIKEAGFDIKEEFVQNIFEKDKERKEEESIARNYSAILVRHDEK